MSRLSLEFGEFFGDGLLDEGGEFRDVYHCNVLLAAALEFDLIVQEGLRRNYYAERYSDKVRVAEHETRLLTPVIVEYFDA